MRSRRYKKQPENEKTKGQNERRGSQVVAQLSVGGIHLTESWGHKGPHGTADIGPDNDVATDLCRSDNKETVTCGSWLNVP